MGNGYDKKRLQNFPFLTLKAKGSLGMLVQSSDFIDHHVALFDSIDAQYKKSESVIFERNQN